MPSTISLGPYHRGKPMDQDKGQALRLFLFQDFMMPFRRLVEAVESVAELLKEFYEMPDDKWGDPNEFLEMMIVDGFFVLSVLCFVALDNSFFPYQYERPDIIDEIAFIFRQYWGSYSMAQIRRDMLLLENQLPIILLCTLMKALRGEAEDVNMLILNFLDLKPPPAHETDERPRMDDAFGLHILDVYRKRKFSTSMLEVEEGSPLLGSESMRWSATKLDMAEVQLCKSHSESFNDITFSRGTLQLPRIDIDDTTEILFLNLMAFERRHASTHYKNVTNYVRFMDGLIYSSNDVALLRRKDIICLHGRRSDDVVVNLFKKVSEKGLVDEDKRETYSKIGKELSDYLMPWYRAWRSKFVAECFFIVERVSPTWVPGVLKTHWVILTILVGFFYFGTNILQTLYTILSYSHQK